MTELSRRERKKKETQEKLFNSAMQLFKTRGFTETSVEDITKHADLGKGTFYNYYSSKEAVIIEFSRKRFREISCGRGLESPLTSQEKIVALLQEWAVFMVEEREIALIALRSSWENDLDSDLYRRLKAIIAAGQREGEIGGEYDAGFLAQSLEGMVVQHFMRWIVAPNRELSLEINKITHVFFEGLQMRSAK